jgi:hypothetical protein
LPIKGANLFLAIQLLVLGETDRLGPKRSKGNMMLILLILLLLLFAGGGGYYGHRRWGAGGGVGIGLGTIVVIILVVYLLGGAILGRF